MSHYWCLHCPKCKESTEDINKGEQTLEAIVKAFPILKQAINCFAEAQKAMGDDEWKLDFELTLCGYSGSMNGLCHFLDEHYSHGLVVQSEYSSVPSIVIDYDRNAITSTELQCEDSINAAIEVDQKPLSVDPSKTIAYRWFA